MTAIKLPMSIARTRAKTPPNRAIELECKIENPHSFDITILSAWLWIKAFNNIDIAEGRLFYSMNNLVDPAVILAGKSGAGAIVIPLPSTVMSQIEEKRGGRGDLPLTILSKVLVSQPFSPTLGAAKVLGIPFESQFEAMGTPSVEYTIPQSDWIKILKNIGWSELELLEIPSVRLSGLPVLAQAYKRLADAEDCYRRGDWEQSMATCRKAFEAMIKDSTSENELKKADKALSHILGEGPKSERLNELVKSLSEFLHLARHEQRPPVHIKSADARLALHLTAALLSYLGGQAS